VEVVLVQPRQHREYAVFMVNPRETVSYSYDQNPLDPVIKQQFTLVVDPLSGGVEQACTVFLPRRPGAEANPDQLELKGTASLTQFIDTPDDLTYRWRGLPCEQREFQVFGLDLKGALYFSFDELKAQVDTAFETIVPYQGELQEGVLQARQLTWSRSYYWNENQDWDKSQDGALPLCDISAHGLLHHVENAVFTTSYMNKAYGDRLSEQTVREEGGYIYEDGYWWNKGLVQYYYKEPSRFYMPFRTANPYAPSNSGTCPSPLCPETVSDYDEPYYLSPVKVTQYLEKDQEKTNANITTLSLDYLSMQAYQVVDINGNVAQVMFDPLGTVVVSTLFGSEGEHSVGGMRLYPYNGQDAQYQPRVKSSSGGTVTFDNVLNNPEYYLQGASSYYYYNTLAWQEGCAESRRQPVSSILLERDNDYQTAEGITPFSCITTITYNDGGGNTLETKLKVEAPGHWQVTGRTVYNNKGLPAQEYLPYFIETPYYVAPAEIKQEDPAPPTVYHYDPAGRVVRVDTPKRFFSRTLYSPWQEAHYDEDDTVLQSLYYNQFMKQWNEDPDHTQRQIDEKDALDKAAKFEDTPGVKVLNNQGFMILDIADNGEGRLLTSRYKVDIQGRVTESIDPRLYHSNLSEGTHYYNFKYMYMMGQDEPVYTNSADAGITRTFNNIFGNPAQAWNARGMVALTGYDAFQRPIWVEEQGIVTETYTYGESLSLAESKAGNLRGQVIEQNDQAGTLEFSLYSIRGESMHSRRRLTQSYDGVIDWADPEKVKMEVETYPFSFSYDALSRVINETAPDGSVTINSYDISGRLETVTVNTSGGDSNPVIEEINYNANGQRTSVTYGNGVTTVYTYENTTQRTLNIYSSREGGEGGGGTLQNLDHTYDPVGNLTRLRDKTYEHVFCNNQEVTPLSGYTYDAVYRLLSADGRQHPGIGKDTHINGFKQSKFGYICPADTKDYTKLQNYWEDYTYDDSGNLVLKQHHTGSADGLWSQATPVRDNNNRLLDRSYDDAGNLLSLELNNSVALHWDFRNQLSKTGIIEREGGIDDADYFNYDASGNRVRKVIQRMAHQGGVTQLEEKIYLGNYEVKKIKNGEENSEALLLDRRTLRVMDEGRCVLIIHHWETDTLQREVSKAGAWRLRYQLSNLQNSVALEVDEEAAVISYEEYFPYGGTAIIAGNDIKEVKLKDYRYSGKERDDSTGLYYYGARYYAPWLGKWLNPDPAGTIDGLNLYAFVGGNPVTYIDDTGNAKRKKNNDDKKKNKAGVSKITTKKKSRRPQRNRRTPQEATAARDRRVREAMLRDAQNRQRDREIRDLARQVRLARGPRVIGERQPMDNMAINIHGAYGWDGHDTESTTAVGRVRTGSEKEINVVASQRRMNDMKTYARRHYGIPNKNYFPSAPSGSHVHAEMWLLYNAREKGWTLISIGVSQEICFHCEQMLNKAGVAYDKNWADQHVTKSWKDPWELYGEKNPFTGDEEEKEYQPSTIEEDIKKFNIHRRPGGDDDGSGSGGGMGGGMLSSQFLQTVH
jgi:RHS repeat-associated protein